MDIVYRQLESLQNVIHYLNPSHMFPPFRNWAISPDFAYHLIHYIEMYKPTHIVECGSGVSTLICRYVIEKNNMNTQITSIDHQDDYLDKTISLIKQHGLLQNIDFISTPLTEFKENDQQFLWYDVKKLAHIQNISMMIIDGPPGHLCKCARYPALPYFFERLDNNACILLDDADRTDEKEIIEKWIQDYPSLKKETVEGTEKGLVLLHHKQ